MTTMNISLPESLKAFVDERVAEGDYCTSSEFVRELIRHEKDRTTLRKLLLDGVNSGVAGELNAEYFQQLRDRARTGE